MMHNIVLCVGTRNVSLVNNRNENLRETYFYVLNEKKKKINIEGKCNIIRVEDNFTKMSMKSNK